MGGLIGRGAKGFVYFARRSVPLWFPGDEDASRSRSTSSQGSHAPAESWHAREQAVAIKIFGAGGIGMATKEIKVYRVSCQSVHSFSLARTHPLSEGQVILFIIKFSGRIVFDPASS